MTQSDSSTSGNNLDGAAGEPVTTYANAAKVEPVTERVPSCRGHRCLRDQRETSGRATPATLGAKALVEAIAHQNFDLADRDDAIIGNGSKREAKCDWVLKVSHRVRELFLQKKRLFVESLTACVL